MSYNVIRPWVIRALKHVQLRGKGIQRYSKFWWWKNLIWYKLILGTDEMIPELHSIGKMYYQTTNIKWHLLTISCHLMWFEYIRNMSYPLFRLFAHKNFRMCSTRRQRFYIYYSIWDPILIKSYQLYLLSVIWINVMVHHNVEMYSIAVMYYNIW